MKIVAAELSIDASVLITAPAIAAKTNPRKPEPIRFLMSSGYALSGVGRERSPGRAVAP